MKNKLVANCVSAGRISPEQRKTSTVKIKAHSKNQLTSIFLTRREEELFENAVKRCSDIEKLLASIELQ